MDEKMENFVQIGKALLNEKYDEESREIAKRNIIILTILSIMSIILHSIISYCSYLNNPGYFVNNKATEPIVEYLSTGGIAQMSIMANIFGIFLMFFGYYLLKNHVMKYKSSGLIYVLIGIVLIIGNIYGVMLNIPAIIG
jgi:magnesium-transporting ATPase (P-type)